MRRDRSRATHRSPDPAWLARELVALDALLGEGLVDRVRERVRSARGALRAMWSCPGRPGGPIAPCAACQAIDDADLELVQRDIAARLAGYASTRPDMGDAAVRRPGFPRVVG